MISFLVVSHSPALAQGVKDLLQQMAPDVPIEAVGGDEEGHLGSDFSRIQDAMTRLSGGPLCVLFDLGSSMMNAQMARDLLDEENKKRVLLADLPLVEGGVELSVMVQAGADWQQVRAYVQEHRFGKLV